MIVTSALCFVLAISSTFADQVNVDQLMENISSAVAGDMAQVAAASKATNISTLELNTKLLNTTRSSLTKMAPEIKTLHTLTGGSPDLAKNLTLKINQNKALQAALPSDAKVAPRILPLIIGALGALIPKVVDAAKKKADTTLSS